MIKTDTTYVVTKIVDVVDQSGNVRDGSRETISFEAGNRGEFSKGTACQPNGTLDLAVLKSLPKIVGSDDIDRAALSDSARLPVEDQGSSAEDLAPEDTSLDKAAEPTRDIDNSVDVANRPPEEAQDNTIPVPVANGATYDWVLPDQGLPNAAKPQIEQRRNNVSLPSSPPAPITQNKIETTSSSVEERSGAPTSTRQKAELPPEAAPSNRTPDDDGSATTIVDDTTRKLLQSLDCGGEEWHFCDLVELTTPYRKRNIEELFGLTVNTTESFTSQIVGSDLRLDILFPSFPSHLHIAYARRDGTVEHIMSSTDVWPADLPHQFAEADQTIPGPSGLAMIVAIASESPLFTSRPSAREEAKAYLDRLKQRLSEIKAEDPDGSVAASQLLIFVENGEA